MNQYKLGPWFVTIAALLWAADAPFRQFLAKELSAPTIVLMEHMVIAALVFLFLGKYLGELRNLNLREWGSVIFIALGGSALATIFFTRSFMEFNFQPTVPILLQKVQPLFAMLLAAIVLREKLVKNFWIWAAGGIFGAYLLTYPDARVQDFSLSGRNLGALLALGAAFFWGGSTVFGRLVLQKISFQAMTAVRFLGALVFLIIIQLYYGRMSEISTATGKDWLFVLIIAVVAGFVSLFIYYRGLKFTSASIATICELAFPLAAVIVNWIVLDSKLSAIQIAGGLGLLIAVTRLSLINMKENAILHV